MKAPMAFIAEHIVPALRHGCPQGGAIAARRRDPHGLPRRGQHPPDEMPAKHLLRAAYAICAVEATKLTKRDDAP